MKVRLGLEVVLGLSVVLLSVAFFTLLDRKVLGYGKGRKGPNKVSVVGVLQPVLDGVKLFLKGVKGCESMMGWPVLMGAVVVLVSVFGVWSVVMSVWGGSDLFSVVVWMILFGGVVTVSSFVMGLGGLSKFSLVGALRSVAQMVSYEVVMGIGLIIMVSHNGSLGVFGGWDVVVNVVSVVVVLISIVVETNRTPVDFVEGESELVGGVVTEVGGVVFSLVFMGEYGMMGVYCIVLVLGILGWVSVWWVLVGVYVFGWLRMSFPRFRYDLLMVVSWKVLSPVIMLMGIIWWGVF
uniref:NADH-ubiquinone oxidoreductase chain 1 n=1 Tax=Polyacanthorhynchus caballeroi TaxID=178082 RepID=A0A140DJ80_9BILA|nr:NADH dehydrogenase subunit 1 [Polyacanthorhynchus caballeroi]AMK47834.1 NADH dehydrogenase subunit 1 [Polyacanthorhynchus caballeroi]